VHQSGNQHRLTDAELTNRVRAGETRLFAELVRRYQDPVFAMALRFVGTPGDAEDVAQEAFLRAYRGLEGFKGDAKFSTWLYRITWNLCADWKRKHGGPRKQTAVLETAGDFADERVDLEADLLDGEERERVRRALEGLDERYRSVVTLLYYQEMSYDQIAAVLDVPLKTVETRLYRARKMLRVALEATEKDGKRGGR
jgi:RNA polymerase sigma-70 factor (ECF subfamily)